MLLKTLDKPSAKNNLTDEEQIDWLRLFRTENVGPITFFDSLRNFGSVKEVLERLPELSKRGGLKRPLNICTREKAVSEIAQLKKLGGHLIAYPDDDYPELLRSLPDAPPLISVLGNKNLLSQKTLGIVGARNASLNARRFAESLARTLGESGFVISSGFARGIDREAHKGSLKTGTIAVFAGGLDVVYPRENEDLYSEIVKNGGLIFAEMPLSLTPQARHFPRRNRLISGLSQGVIVVEAALHSGSLITARTAAEQGRDVYAVPGFPLDPRAQGTNALLKDGAILIQSAKDVLDVYAHKSFLKVEEDLAPYNLPQHERPTEADLDKVRQKITEFIGATPTSVDEIIRQCQIGGSTVLVVLLELELAGRIQRHPGNQVSLIFEYTHTD